MMANKYSWKNFLGGRTPPHWRVLTDAYYASYCNNLFSERGKNSRNTTLSILGKNKFIHVHLTIPVPGNSGVQGI